MTMAQGVPAIIVAKSLVEYRPQLGDIVVKHGIFTRTKWFGVLTAFQPDGTLVLITAGSLPMVARLRSDEIEKSKVVIHPAILSAYVGAYSVISCFNGQQVIYT